MRSNQERTAPPQATEGSSEVTLPRISPEASLATHVPGTPGSPGVVQSGTAPLVPGVPPAMTGMDAIRILLRKDKSSS